jgi:alkaline phosphatase D
MKTSLKYGVSRRHFLQYMAMVSAVPYFQDSVCGSINESPKFLAYPFSLGVASGDPEPDGVVIWTRLAPDPLDGGSFDSEPIRVGSFAG